MRKIFSYLVIILSLLFPTIVLAQGNITVSPSSLSIEEGSSKTFTITAFNTIGDATIVSSNSSVASVSTSSWSTGMIGDNETRTGTITVTGNSVGTATITLTLDAATFDGENLKGQTRTVLINVVSKPTTTQTTTTTKKPTTTQTTTTTKAATTTAKTTTSKATTTTTTTITTSKDIVEKGLKSVIINGNKHNFSKEKVEYDIEVPSDTTNIKIEYEKVNAKASVVAYGNEVLKDGENKVEVIVTEEDGSKTTYILKITKKSKDAADEDNIVDSDSDSDSDTDSASGLTTTGEKKENKLPLIILFSAIAALLLCAIIYIIVKDKRKLQI